MCPEQDITTSAGHVLPLLLVPHCKCRYLSLCTRNRNALPEGGLGRQEVSICCRAMLRTQKKVSPSKRKHFGKAKDE